MKRLSWLKKERLMLWRTASIWLVLALLMFSCSWLFWLMVDRYTQLQSAFIAMAQPPSVTDHLLVPFFKTMAQVSMLLVAVISGMAIAQERSQGTWIQVFKQPNRMVVNKWLASWSVSGFLLLTLLLAWLCLDGASQLHQPVIGLALLALILLLSWLKALGLYLSSLSSQSGMAILLSLVVFTLLWMLGQNQSVAEFGVNWLVLLSPLKHFDWLSGGQLSVASLIYFLLGTLVFLRLAAWQVAALGGERLAVWKQVLRTLVLIMCWLAAVFAVAKWVPVQSHQLSYKDLLPSNAQEILNQQKHTDIDVFATENSDAGKKVAEFLSPVISLLPDVRVNYLDPASQVEVMAQHGISRQGSMLVRQGGTVEDPEGGHLFVMKELSYEQWFNGLKKLQTPKDDWLVLLEGFEGGDLRGEAPEGFEQWYQSIKNAGYQVAMMSWQEGLNLPSNVKLIMLLAPKKEVSGEVVEWLQQQITQGVSIWWLTEPEQAQQQNHLSLLFDVMPLDSFYAGPLVLKDFPDHAINQSFDRPIDLYQAMTFETASDQVWQNEQGQTLAAAQVMGESRLLVTGDSDFVNNGRLLSGGNLEMSLRQLDWLLGIDDRIDLPTIGMAQSQIHLTKNQVLLYSVLMLLVLPGLLLLVALGVWYRNRR
ncbi:hypothetical protein [Marinicella rhabdoformis]|uniref:hypothetical protein n=1 Tax=Marinicella rhabdoformis TaxID=2580566 RepID=UPI0012AEBC45|nr:hypothetical protein [Marinicella rhabdoformis]